MATGRGEFIQVLIRTLMNYREFVGIDTSDRSVAFASQAFATEPVRIEQMDATSMTFDDESFDTVAISNSLHHMNQLDDVLSEMCRVLRTGGNFLVREMICDSDQSPEQLTHVLLHHWWGKVDTCLGITHRPTYTRAQLDALLRQPALQGRETIEFTFPVEDPRDPEIVERLVQMMDPYVERIREHEDYEQLRIEGESLKIRLREVGYAPARTVFFFGTK